MEKKENNTLLLFLIALLTILLVGLMIFGVLGVINKNTNSSEYETQSLTFDNKGANDTIELTLNDSDKSFDTTLNQNNFEELDLEADFGIN